MLHFFEKKEILVRIFNYWYGFNQCVIIMIVDSCAFRVNHLHYQPDDYGEDPDMVDYEDGDYDHDRHSENR